MNIEEKMSLRGRFTIKILEPDGTLVDQAVSDNVMCNIGMDYLSNFLVSNLFTGTNAGALNFATVPPIYIALGSGTATPAATDTQLVTELGRALPTASASPAPSSSQLPSFTWYTLFGVTTAAWTITEAGVFLGGTATVNSGNLLDHSTVSPSLAKSASQLAQVQVTFSLS